MSKMIEMLKNRSASKIKEQIEEANKSQSNTNPNPDEVQMRDLWDRKNAPQDENAGYVRLRLLPNKFNEEGEFTKDIVPLREFWTRATSLQDFKDEKQGSKWFIRLSRTTLNSFKEFKNDDGNPDPMQEYLHSVYAKHIELGMDKDDESIYSKYYKSMKARNQYVANVYIEECPFNPELEGKVKILKFGNSVYDKIVLALKEQERGKRIIPAIDVFNPISDKGASLEIVMNNEKGDMRFVKYEASFDACDPLMIDGKPCTEEQAVELIEQTHDLFKLYVTDVVKSYEDSVKYFKSQFGFPHDVYVGGSAFKEALEAEAEKDVPEELKKEATSEKPLEDGNADTHNALLERIRQKRKASETSEE